MQLVVRPLDETLKELGLNTSASDIYSKIISVKSLLSNELSCNINTGFWFAGGSILRLVSGQYLESSDIDIFFPDENSFSVARRILDKQTKSKEQEQYEARSSKNQIYSLNYGFDLPDPYSHSKSKKKKPTYETSMALTYDFGNFNVQIIRRMYYKNISQVFGDFDFTVCMFATDGHNIGYTDVAYNDALSKTLRLFKVQKNSTLIRRYYKYLSYGYTPVPGTTRSINEVVRGDIGTFSTITPYTSQ